MQSTEHSGNGASKMVHRNRELLRITSLIYATLASLCNGSIVVFSLYAPTFQARLHYTTFQINGIAIAGSLALYLPMSIMGYVCDRAGSAFLALLSSTLYGAGYLLAACTYSRLQGDYMSEMNQTWLYILMLLAFVFIGTGTCTLYIASVTTCAKNFAYSRYRGLSIAMPVTAFGLSGVLISQAASRLFAISTGDGDREIDVFSFFLFLSVLLFSIGLIGALVLRAVDVDGQEEIGTEASGDSEQPSRRGYNTIRPEPVHDNSEESSLQDRRLAGLTAAVYAFLTDATVWPFALAFFLLVGPTEAFINNLGSILTSLSPHGIIDSTAPATHISIFSLPSTFARLFLGTLTDLFAPAQQTMEPIPNQRFHISRVTFIVIFALLQSFALLFLASGLVQNHTERFWIVSGLMGLGCGAFYTLSPLIVAIVWGVENFGTNFGIITMIPAFGSASWGLIYSALYQSNSRPTNPVNPGDEVFCYGKQCYASTFWIEGCIMWVACALIIWAWKGKGGWQERGIVL
ncbi:hypothetical protein NQ176_g339 [Zarea fungicola]|uniref:Uncharacterized protein n=1 Tax=Zarea fungicola TaxID=93591 RepID=A0ACC1NX71_9HYPO|nr:hypothetical protein NQ176_g339 [Lecanicillium fungicola]